MNDIRRSILWVVFGFSMVLLWDQWQVYNGHKATFFPSPAPASVPAAKPDAKPGDATVPSATATGAPAAGASAVPDAAPAAPRTQHQVSTDVFKLTIDSQGAAIVRAELIKHDAKTPPAKDQPADPLVLLEADKSYAAQSGLVGNTLPNHTTPMTLTSPATTLADGQDTLELRFESPVLDGVKLVKTYTLKRGAYDIGVRHEVINQGTAAIKPQLYLQLVRDNSTAGSATPFYSTFTGPAVYSSLSKYQKVEFTDIDKNKATFDKEATDGYVAMVQHYFASAWLLPDGVKRDNYVDRVTVNQAARYRAGTITGLADVAPGQSQAVEARLFLGPQDEKLLERLAPGLELVKDYGWLTILAKPLYWLLEKIHGFVSNWGWSIVLLVVLIKAAFYWLNATAYRSMAKMKAINPRIMEMRARLKDNPQQMQQEMMKIYREEKVNPLGGCVPIMIQIPVFIALYWVLLSSVEMRNAPWLGWITDLSTPDRFYILPAVMTLTTLLQTALNPTPPDPMQAKMMWFMPLIFSVMFFFFPAGLVMYWITNNVLSIAQQWVINTRMGVPPQFNLPKFK
ncbi:membrane protein insertase YidC [Hydrogenophaga sp. OTU3427]|uniref:membrane protein insertase YidC n=1 Tax=Hydrogenophaga sp. OTU3427 TaxID=3043856 RepID=UPI00313B64A8